MEHRVLLIRSPLARSRRMFSGINSSGAAPRKSVCTARMHRRETCTGTLQLQCGTAALHLATVASEALAAAEAWKLCASGRCFSQRQRDRGTRITRTEETMGRDEEGEKSPEEEDRHREGTKKEKGEPRGCRFTSTSSRRGKRNTPPFVSLYLFSSPFYPCSVFLLFPSPSHSYNLSPNCLSLATM